MSRKGLKIQKCGLKKFNFLFWILVFGFWTYPGYTQTFKQEAIEYRNRGYTAQQSGDIDTALVFYQKAISLDPYYAVAYNDMGIIYEIKGYPEKAESAYLKAISINPNFAEAHSNLAFFYETRKMYDKAVVHWSRRIELGSKDDLWTQKCWEKMWQYAPDKAKELEAKLLSQELAIQMEKEKEVRIVKAKKLYQEAMVFYNRKDYLRALPLFQEAHELLPDDPEVAQMYQDVFAKTREINISLHYEQAMNYYRQGEYGLAKEEFEKILELIPQQPEKSQ
ncbi:MAG: tetratricopeptide repeat protein [Candidatus Omnitrophica bacterium]|nr:tetratricopeptide repeat protein [Candidatus Omnitrophota bacterium]